ncbi:MAG: zinc-ribbon domain-containing protein [Bacteroidaceae bacterium]|nr:zinc-ribbon domain-containing protein [Bacteroidaceae bacterium]
MAQCTKCGNELKPGARFCTKCGTPVSAPVDQMKSASQSMTCTKCGNELKPGAKFCTKCGNPVSAPVDQMKSASQSMSCPKCGKALKPGARFCTGCGAPVGQGGQEGTQAGEKGWFTDGVRAVANFVTGGQLNRDIQQEQQAAVRQQARADRGEIQDAQQAQQSAERAQIRAEREAQRARDRRSMEAVQGVDVVRGRTIWNIQPGEIARRIKESELEEIEKLKGIIVQEGCTALIFANGELVSTLSSGAYLFYKSVEEEQAALKAAVEKAEKEMEEKERKAIQERRQAEPTFRQLGVVGEIKRGFNWVGRLIFGEKKNENKEKVQKRKIDYARILSRLTQAPVMSVYLVSDRYIPMTFGGQVGQDGGIQFAPFSIPTRVFDVQVGVSLQLKVSDIHGVATNYLADKQSLTTNMLYQMLVGSIDNVLRQALRNVDYQQTGLPMEVIATLKAQIQQIINMQLHGIECAQVLQITDSNAEFERFRSVERELYCTEKELDYLQRTGEFRNRLAIETNKQTIDKATTDEELRYALMQINKDGLIHDDEMEAFTLMLNAQKRLREAKSQEEEYEALIDLKKSRLVKDEDLAVLQDALLQNKIQRESVTEIMRIQHQQSVDAARLEAEWAIGDKKQDHDWEREDLQRRRNWGIEDEQREREWMHEEQEYNRNWERDEQMYNRNFTRRQQLDEYDWQKKIREEDYDWQNEERRRESEWQQRVRETQMRREDEQTAFERSRINKFDDQDILDRQHRNEMERLNQTQQNDIERLRTQQQGAADMMRIMKDAEKHRDSTFATMSADQIKAAQLDRLSEAAQVASFNADNQKEQADFFRKQQEKAQTDAMEREAQARADRKEDLDRMERMMGMFGKNMLAAAGANVANEQAKFQQQQQFQQQRYDDQVQRANEYKQDAYRQQDRMDSQNQVAMGSMAQINTAAAGNLYTNNTNINMQPQQGYQQMPQQGYQQMPQQGYQQMPQQGYQQMPQQGGQQQEYPQQPMDQQQMGGKQCPQCGQVLDADAMFCDNCCFSFQ